jgi:hypothetical protein
VYHVVAQWQHSRELYWAAISLLNQKLSLVLLLNFAAASYTLFVVLIHSFFFGETKEAERYVPPTDPGNLLQVEVQARLDHHHAALPLHVVRLLAAGQRALLHDFLDLLLVGRPHPG